MKLLDKVNWLSLQSNLANITLCFSTVEISISGEFGVVYKGHILKGQGQIVSEIVAIKTLKGNIAGQI